MKRKITFLLAALLLMSGLTWAQTDVLNHDVIGVSGTSYSSWSDLTLTSGAVYAGNTAGGNNAIQMRSNNNNSGIVTTTSAGVVTNITVAWNSNTADSRTLNVYGSSTAYEAASDLYGSNAGTLIGTIAKGTTELEITDEYAFIGIRSASGALYLDEIQITWTDGSGVTPPSITVSNVEIAYDVTQGAIEYTINNPVDAGVLSAATEAEWLTIGTVGETVPFTCPVNPDGERTATVTLTYTYNTDQTVTKNVTVTQATNPNAPGSEANPYTVAQARAAIDAGTGTQGVYATGIVSAIPTAYSTQYENVTFNMVDEEGDEEFLQAYRCGGDEAANVQVGDVVVVYGNLTKYGSTYEFGQGCQVVSLTHPVITDPIITVTPATVNVDADEHDGTLALAYANLTINNMEDFDVQYYNAEGQEANEPDWIEVLVAEQDPQIGEGYVVSYYMLENDDEARTAYFKVYAMDDETNLVYSNLVTINQDAYVAPVASITIDPDFLTVDAGMHYGDDFLPLTYENIIVENAQSFGLQFYTAEGEETGMPTWFYAMVTPQTGSDAYQVTVATMPNDGDARSTYFKVYAYDADSTLVYSNLATVTQAAPVHDYAVLPFVWEGGPKNDFLALEGVTANGLGTDYASNNAPYLIKLDSDGDYIMVKTDSQPGTVTIGVKMVGGGNTSTITVQGSADGETFTDIEVLTISGAQNDILTLETTTAFGGDDRYVKLLFTKGSNVGVGPITITKGTAPSITLSPDTFNLDAVGPLNGMHLPTATVTYHNFEITQASDFHVQFYNAEGEEQEMPTWLLHTEVSGPITDSSSYQSIYQSISIVTANEGPARSAYYRVYAFDADSIPVYSNLVTYNQAGVPQPSITVTPDVVNVDAEEHDGTLDLTYENLTISDMTDFDIQYYNAEGQEAEEPTWIEVVVAEQDPTIGDGYVVSYYMVENEGEARTAYFKVYAMDDETNLVYSNLVTINQAAYVAPVLDYAELPFEFNGGRADIETTDGLTQEGLGTDYNANSNPTTKLKFDGTGDWMLLHFNEAPGTLLFDIKGNSFSGGTFTVQASEDGVTYEDLAAYTELGDVATMTFDNLDENVRYIKWIYTEKVTGNVGLGGIHLYEVGGGPAPVASITVTPDVVDLNAEQHAVQLPLTYENIEVTNYESFTVHYYDAEGEEIQPNPGVDWYYFGVTGNDNEGYQLTGLVIANEGEARSAYMKVSALDAAGETVYSNLVTVNQAAYVAPPVPGEWVMTRLADLTEDDVFVIVGVYDVDESSYAMPNDGTGAPSAVEVTMVGNTLSGDIADNLKWNIGISEDGYIFYPNGETETWLYCTNANNGVRVGTNENNVFSMTSEGYLFNNATERYIGIYNSQDWRCYTSINNNIKEQTFAFYKRVDESEIQTYTLEIEGYGTSAGGYYLIASPVSMVRPTTENGFLTNEYDLYYFDQAQEDGAWRNYKAKHFNIASGKGYLYASQENTTLTFTGMPYEGNGEVALDYVGDTTWNLIGNPYSYSATVNRDFYVLNADGSELVLSETSEVNPMQGIFVDAVEADETVAFVTGGGVVPPTPGGPGAWDDFEKLNLRVSNGNGNGDFARIRFGEGRALSKFMFNENNTKLYFTQGGNDYAVVRSEAEGEMPVNFKAAENGIYTLSINPENIEMDYLHLIDNMTGMDIDLLQTPDYSFEATVNDNAARFTLMFAGLTGIEENNEQFAFFSNGNLIVNNEGEATLQVIDMNGRMVKNQTINGNASVNMGTTAGVYMLRLVNGDNVMVQKVVVK